MANLLTSLRVLLSAALLFTPVRSGIAAALYLLCGLSDMLDGFIARKTHTESDFGARLDSVADLLFLAVCFARLLSAVRLPAWLWAWIALIALLRLTAAAISLARTRRVALPHTVPDKLAGFLLFLLPLSLPWIPLSFAAFAVCIPATFAAIWECHKMI